MSYVAFSPFLFCGCKGTHLLLKDVCKDCLFLRHYLNFLVFFMLFPLSQKEPSC